MINKLSVDKWLKAKDELDVAKLKEMTLRKALAASVINNEVAPKAYHVEVAHGRLTATLKHNFKIDMGVYTKIEHKLKSNELDCIKLDPKLKLKEFNLLDKKSLLRKAVIETPATPTLTFKPKE